MTKLENLSCGKFEAFSLAFVLIGQTPTVIPFVKAVFFVIAPFDVVRANHELKKAVTASLMNDVIVL